MKELCVVVEGEEIPIISYEEVNGKLIRKNAYYDYQEQIISMISRKFVNGYVKQSKAALRENLTELSNRYNETLDLTDEDVINIYICKHITFREDIEYNISAEGVKNLMIERLSQDLDNGELLTLSYSNELELDPDYRQVTKDLRKIMSILKTKIMSCNNMENLNVLSQDLRMLVNSYFHLKEGIINRIIHKIKDNPNYQKNKTKAYYLIPGIVEENIENYLDLENNTISIEKFLSYVPVEIIVKAANEFLGSKKLNHLLKIYGVQSIICRKENGEAYKLSEVERAIIVYYSSLLKNEQAKIARILKDSVSEKEYVDTAYDLEGPYSFKQYYSKEEMDYYGHGEDSRDDIYNEEEENFSL